MAPATATTVGMTRGLGISDPNLQSCLSELSAFELNPDADESITATAENGGVTGSEQTDASQQEGEERHPVSPPLDVDDLVTTLQKYPKWKFQEQVSDVD